MSSHHLSRRDAERIVDAPAESDLPVGHALRALRAPGRPAELLREDAAVAAFHSARLAPAPRAAGAVAPTRSRSAALRAVAATGLVVALASGGFALAATGHLPALPDRATDRATGAVTQHPATRDTSPSDTATGTASASTSASGTASAPESASTPATASGTGASSGAASEDPTGPTEVATAAPTPRLEGLCRAFQAGDKSAHGAALDSAAFTALAAAAGSRNAVASYCVALVGEPKATGKPTPTPKPTPAATGKPTSKPTPSGTPSATPSVKPSAKASTGSAPTAPGTASTTPSPADQGKPTDTGKPETTGKP